MTQSENSKQDIEYMRRALNLARQGEGRTSPNPAVGAVIVRDGQIVGEGYHHGPGRPHAEIEALQAAGDAAEGSTVYVTLEPCSHHGRTPPCSQALIKAGVAKVIYAVGDPNPKVNGKGRDQLRAAGVEVSNSVLRDEATALNRPFFKYIQTGLPLVTAKFAMSLDGKIATRTGHSQWISNPSSREMGHRLRQISDTILVGAGTVLADDPRLTTRLAGVEPDELSNPVRIVADSRGRVTTDARIFDPDLPGETILATTRDCPDKHLDQLVAQGVQVWVLPKGVDGRVDLLSLMKRVARYEYTSLMVEGGGQLLGAMFEARLVDRVWAFIAPKIIGGESAPGPVGGLGFDQLDQAIQLESIVSQHLDGDLWIQADVQVKSDEG